MNWIGDSYWEKRNKDMIQQLFDCKRVNIYVDPTKYIWFFNKRIGFVKDANTIICTNSIFKQELIDWINK